MPDSSVDTVERAVEPKPKAFASGAHLLWKRPRILWWIFAVNLLLAFLGTVGVSHGLADDAGARLNQSLESARRLVYGFDVSAMAELGALPEDPLRGTSTMFLWPSFLFTVFLLFMTGGILVSYSDELPLDAAAFFEACGRHFWRFFRLMIYFAIVLLPLAILASIAGRLYQSIDERSVSPYSAPLFLAAEAVFVLWVVLCLRLWFDMAQVLAVAGDHRSMHRMLRKSAALLWHNFGSLFWVFFRISLIGWVLFGAGLYVWMMVLRPESTRSAFFIAQLMILLWLGTRLWQRASETDWYRQYRIGQYAQLPLPAQNLAPAPASEPEGAPEK
jgi:hypothetical protein